MPCAARAARAARTSRGRDRGWLGRGRRRRAWPGDAGLRLDGDRLYRLDPGLSVRSLASSPAHAPSGCLWKLLQLAGQRLRKHGRCRHLNEHGGNCGDCRGSGTATIAATAAAAAAAADDDAAATLLAAAETTPHQADKGGPGRGAECRAVAGRCGLERSPQQQPH